MVDISCEVKFNITSMDTDSFCITNVKVWVIVGFQLVVFLYLIDIVISNSNTTYSVYVVEEYICGISENAETLNVSK
jgi:hypothetical protein